MGAMDQRVQQIAGRTLVLIAGILINHRAGGVIADIAVLGIGMIGHGLGRLVDIAHGRQHRIGHHREQQQCQQCSDLMFSRLLKKSARRNGFPSGWSAAFGFGLVEAMSVGA
jgi:hypothetical protein